MSQSFGTLINADGVNVARIDAIRSALRKVWVFKDEDSFFYASKNGEAHMLTMSWGYSDTEPRRGFAERIARAVWEANVEYCKLRVCIQDYHDIFKFRVGDYLRMRPDAPFDSLFGQMNQTGGEKCANDQIMRPIFPKNGVTHYNRVFHWKPVKGVTYDNEEKQYARPAIAAGSIYV